MNAIEAIAARRSIRRFKPDPVPEDALRAVLQAGILAPSGSNRQPWRFLVVRQNRRAEMIAVLRDGIRRAKERGENVGGADFSLGIMEQAPVHVLVVNPYGIPPWERHDTGQMFDDVVDIQSAGAAIQNMLLAAVERGLGSLWICDVFAAYKELMQWMGERGELIAAVSLGYADEHPDPRPRKPWAEVVRDL